MKKIFSIFTVLLLITALTMAFVACGEDDDNVADNNGSNNSTLSVPEQRSLSDKELLESKGYTTSLITTSLGSLASTVGGENGDVIAALMATTDQQNYIYIYYFKDNETAEKCYGNFSELASYHLLDGKIYYDPTGSNVYEDDSGKTNANSDNNDASIDSIFELMLSDSEKFSKFGGFYSSQKFYGEYADYLNDFAESTGIHREDIYGLMIVPSARDSYDVKIVYFVDESTAAHYYNYFEEWKQSPAYTLKGLRIIYDYAEKNVLG